MEPSRTDPIQPKGKLGLLRSNAKTDFQISQTIKVAHEPESLESMVRSIKATQSELIKLCQVSISLNLLVLSSKPYNSSFKTITDRLDHLSKQIGQLLDDKNGNDVPTIVPSFRPNTPEPKEVPSKSPLIDFEDG